MNSPNFKQELLLKTLSFIISSLLHKLLRVPKDAHDNFFGVPSSFLRVKDAISGKTLVRENPGLVFAMFCARLFICALWSPAGKGLTSWLSFVVSTVSLALSHWYPGSMWYLIVSIPDLCTLTLLYLLYFY